MDVLFAWIFLIGGLVLPVIHVLLSPAAGTWRPPAGAGCPFGPRAGWLIVVVLLPFVGWLMFLAALRKKRGNPIS
ncbi:MAG: hypothetical protein FJX42_07020 [Alphaproteobacteria bacterium]|nr:hypothetical protein [Alphaproteobacteria bacterium]